MCSREKTPLVRCILPSTCTTTSSILLSYSYSLQMEIVKSRV